MKKFLLLLPLVACIGCDSLNLKEGNMHAESAVAASQNGDWNAARKHWAAVITNGELGDASSSRMAIAYFEYGRALGVTCNYKDAEAWLLKALDADRNSNGQIHFDLVELARLNLDQGNYERSAFYFGQAIAALNAMDAANKAPTEYANILEEYSKALQGVGNTSASQYLQKAQSIRAQHPQGYSVTDRTPYGTQCQTQAN